jgi:hypothetical protein
LTKGSLVAINFSIYGFILSVSTPLMNSEKRENVPELPVAGVGEGGFNAYRAVLEGFLEMIPYLCVL